MKQVESFRIEENANMGTWTRTIEIKYDEQKY